MPQIGFGTPWAEQIAHLQRKLNLPTEAWDDITRSAHDRAFIVAGAARADLLQDLRTAMTDAATKGGLAGFRKDFKRIVADGGWTGWTGEGSAAGQAWRTRIIYQTNMATSYAAGRWRQLNEPGFAKLMPYWQYVHAEGQLHPRPEHQRWHGLTLPREHAFWKTHFAPNGWGCRCEIRAVARPAPGAATEPPPGWAEIDQATGAPVGIDKGFDYAPGANAATPLQALIDQKLIKLDAPIGAQMWRALKPALAMERELHWWETLDGWLATPQTGRTAVVGAIEPAVLRWLSEQHQIRPQSAAIGIAEGLIRGAKQARHLRDGDAMLEAEWRNVAAILAAPEAVYFDTRTGKVV